MEIRCFTRALYTLPMLVALGGCVAGQVIKLDYQPDTTLKIQSPQTVAVEVRDNRPFVLTGAKNKTFLGIYRAGFGNTWDVTTESGRPLASDMTRDLHADLTALGFKVADSLNAPRKLRVTINDWNFDAYINGRFWYEIQVWTLDEQDNVLHRHTLKDNSVIEGSGLMGAQASFPQEIPRQYRGIVRKIVRDNADALRSLQ